MNLRPIPEDFYAQAAAIITAERKRSGDNPNLDDILKVLKTYVFCGQNKTIEDWSGLLSENSKDEIIKVIQATNKIRFGFTPVYSNTWTNLDINETQGALGNINPTVVYPRRYQEEYEKAIQLSHDTSAGGAADTSLSAALNRVFGSIGGGIKSALSGLGLSPEILIIVIALVIVLVLRPR